MRRVSLAATFLCALAASFSCTALSATKDISRQVDKIVGKLRRASTDDVWAAKRQLAQLGEEALPAFKERIAGARPAGQVALAKALCELGHPEAAVEPLVTRSSTRRKG